MLLFFEDLIFPTMSKTTEFSKKTQGILGINDKLKNENKDFLGVYYFCESSTLFPNIP
jgi:hypothetical protein